jgi:hypothetical protein
MLPINFSQTRRERFMARSFPKRSIVEFPSAVTARQAKADDDTLMCSGLCQPPPPKPNACANEPKPPRLTDELEDDEEEDDDPPDEESLLKKLLRDELPLPPPWPPDDELRGAQSAPGCGVTGAVTPGCAGAIGWQFCRGISA